MSSEDKTLSGDDNKKLKSDLWQNHTFTLLASFHHDVSIQLLQLSVQVVQPSVGRAQLTVHLRDKTWLTLNFSQKTSLHHFLCQTISVWAWCGKDFEQMWGHEQGQENRAVSSVPYEEQFKTSVLPIQTHLIDFLSTGTSCSPLLPRTTRNAIHFHTADFQAPVSSKLALLH